HANNIGHYHIVRAVHAFGFRLSLKSTEVAHFLNQMTIMNNDGPVEQMLAHAVDGIIPSLVIGKPVHDRGLGMDTIHPAPTVDRWIVQSHTQFITGRDAITGILNGNFSSMVPIPQGRNDAGKVGSVYPTVPLRNLNTRLKAIADPV